MDITTDQIKAFLEISRKGSFSQAGKVLGLTQAALSIRIKKLEETLEKSLLIRGKSGITLSEAGKEFLLFAETHEALIQEYMGKSTSNDSRLSGCLRIGCFSTIGRSLVLPAINKLLVQNPQVELNFMVREMHELIRLLHTGEVDFVFLDQELKREGLVQKLLGYEEYVFVTGRRNKNPDIFLNHDENDMMSFRYFEAIGQKKVKLQRRYLDEIYSVLDGVANGLGVSVLPIHLTSSYKGIDVPNPNKKMKSPVYICFKSRAYYTKLFQKSLHEMEAYLSTHLVQ